MDKVFLTFDDGPSKNFPNLLNYLVKNKYKAVFFCCGKELQNKKIEKHLIKAIKKGFIIGNHSYSHPNFNLISFKKAKKEILETDKIIEEIYKKAKIRRPIKLFRFPFFRKGLFNYFKLQKFLKHLWYEDIIKSKKYDVRCSLDPKDWDKHTTKELALKRIKSAKKGDIIGLHDSKYSFDFLLKPVCGFLSSKKLI